jgi:hypothetical protein
MISLSQAFDPLKGKVGKKHWESPERSDRHESDSTWMRRLRWSQVQTFQLGMNQPSEVVGVAGTGPGHGAEGR